MAIQSEQFAHKDLVGGTQTSLHSHAGGGSQEIEVSESIGAKATEVQVNFAGTFTGIPKIALTPHSAHIVWITEITTTYFKWNNDSKNVDVTVDWMAVYI